jgi:hypothetical protein
MKSSVMAKASAGFIMIEGMGKLRRDLRCLLNVRSTPIPSRPFYRFVRQPSSSR